MYRRLDLKDPKVIFTGRGVALMAAIREVFPHIANLLCLWHINKCVQAEWKPLFQDRENPEEKWQSFYKWRCVVYAKSEEAYDSAETCLSNTYKDAFSTKMDYLQNTWFIPHQQRVVKCYTNSIRHDGNVVTSRVEGGRIVLKSKVGVSTGDLLTVVTHIDSLLQNQHQEYIIALGEARNNTPMVLKGGNTIIYRDLTPYITPFASLKLYMQFRRLADKSQLLPPRTRQFTSTMGLPCVHRIEVSIIIQLANFFGLFLQALKKLLSKW